MSSETMSSEACENTDVEIWRETPGDYYSPNISVTQNGGIAINVSGLCIVKTVREWHMLAVEAEGIPPTLSSAI